MTRDGARPRRDIALLAVCNHTVLTHGTLGFWTAYMVSVIWYVYSIRMWYLAVVSVEGRCCESDRQHRDWAGVGREARGAQLDLARHELGGAEGETGEGGDICPGVPSFQM